MNGTLLIGLLICHFLGDYTHLSTGKMLAAKRFGTPVLPIMAHAFVHTTLMAVWMTIFGVDFDFMVLAALLQFITHTIIDITKGKVNYLIPIVQDNTKKPHWYVFGIDQTLHILVLIAMTNLCTI